VDHAQHIGRNGTTSELVTVSCLGLIFALCALIGLTLTSLLFLALPTALTLALFLRALFLLGLGLRVCLRVVFRGTVHRLLFRFWFRLRGRRWARIRLYIFTEKDRKSVGQGSRV